MVGKGAEKSIMARVLQCRYCYCCDPQPDKNSDPGMALSTRASMDGSIARGRLLTLSVGNEGDRVMFRLIPQSI